MPAAELDAEREWEPTVEHAADLKVRPESSCAGTDEPPTRSVSRLRALKREQRILVAVESLVSISGLAGGIHMATHPMTAMPLEYLEGTWFHTWRWPGLALLFFVGICPASVVIATIQGRKVEVWGHLAVGIGLVAWILLEAAWVVVSPGLQILFGMIGVFIVVLAVAERKRSRRESGNV